jgi:hypothetical protein
VISEPGSVRFPESSLLARDLQRSSQDNPQKVINDYQSLIKVSTMNLRLQPRASFLLFLAFVLAQLAWLLMPADLDSYRRKERAEAALELRDTPSAATKTVFETELSRLRKHNSDTLRNAVVVFLLVDLICVGLLWKDRHVPLRC